MYKCLQSETTHLPSFDFSGCGLFCVHVSAFYSCLLSFPCVFLSFTSLKDASFPPQLTNTSCTTWSLHPAPNCHSLHPDGVRTPWRRLKGESQFNSPRNLRYVPPLRRWSPSDPLTPPLPIPHIHLSLPLLLLHHHPPTSALLLSFCLSVFRGSFYTLFLCPLKK